MGDLISRSESIRRLKAMTNIEVIREGIETAIAIIETQEDAKNVDDEQVRHGRWIWNGLEYTYSCSECKCDYFYTTAYGLLDRGFVYASFCPNCGAKMDGGD